ncbi:MAG: RraA family protein [Halovenus sp.]
MPGGIPIGELCERYESLYTGAITDELDERGYQNQTIRGGVEPLDPSLSMAGTAHTAVGHRNTDVDPEEQIREHLRMVGEAPEHGVLVIEANDDVSAQVGELMTTSLMGQGCRGCLCDGGTRDTEFILDQGFPVFTGHRTPEDSVPRWELLNWDTDVVVGGVKISPGDIVVGDRDGVVVVPREVAAKVLEAAEDRIGDETRVREEIRKGTSPLEAYDEFGVF